MKKKKRLLKVTIILFLIIIIILLNNESKKYTTLTQLSNQSPRQMMGYILKTNNGKIIVIDGGTEQDTDNLIKNITENGGIVDYWFITHAHDDHSGAFINVVENTDIPINNVYVSLNDRNWYEENEPGRIEHSSKLIDIVENSRIKDKVKEVKLNELIKIDNLKVEVLGIKNPEIIENAGNEQSMVLKFYTKNKSLLILGDIGNEGSKKLLNTQKGKLKSDIVQMSHHGQRGATKELYEAIRPEICLWPTTEWLWNNDVGEGFDTGPFKTLETRNWLEEIGAEVNYIEKDGDITIKI